MTRTPWAPSVEPVPQWQTIYCSLILLLVVFFVMLIAYSTIDQGRFRKIKKVAGMGNDLSVQERGMDQAILSLQQLTDRLGMKGDLSISRTADGFKAVVPTPVLFGSGDASLNKSVISVLNGIIRIAKSNNLAIQVEGHTDNVPIETAQFPSNWELSTLRAVNILRYIQTNGDIPQDRLAAVGFGEYQPIASNETPEGRQRNRRIEIIFRPVK
jgi:chemotaxis protein MotB